MSENHSGWFLPDFVEERAGSGVSENHSGWFLLDPWTPEPRRAWSGRRLQRARDRCLRAPVTNKYCGGAFILLGDPKLNLEEAASAMSRAGFAAGPNDWDCAEPVGLSQALQKTTIEDARALRE
ncbi:MAG: hypothetical protein ABI333_17250 [bacterium]